MNNNTIYLSLYIENSFEELHRLTHGKTLQLYLLISLPESIFF